MILNNPIDNLPLKQIQLFYKEEHCIISKIMERKYLTATAFFQKEYWLFKRGD